LTLSTDDTMAASPPPLSITLSHDLQLKGGPDALLKDLKDRFTFLNPKWLENERMKRWNRGTPKILKFYDRERNGIRIPRGYLRQLILQCRRDGIDYQIDDRRNLPGTVDFSFTGDLRGYQKDAVAAMMPRDFGTLCAPTGSGKTVMALAMVAKRRQPSLVVVHTRDLADQWVDRIGTFLGIPAEGVGRLGGGKKSMGDQITVALVQTLVKCAEDIAAEVGFLLVDECHRCPSRTFTEAVTAFDCRYMLGLSATPWRRDNLSRLIFWHLGDVHHEVDKRHLVATGDVLDADVFFRDTEFRPFHDPVSEYSKMLSELTRDDARNRMIVDDVAAEAERSAGTCLVLSDRKQHCYAIQSLLRFRHHLSSEILTGDRSVTERREIIENLARGKVKILIATGQLVGEGFDCPNLTTLFLATPVKFSGRVLQYLGRVLRPAPGKQSARVFDYVDANVEVLAAAAKSRRRVYG
jgi:superfamily II DNA or RNA helicase